MYEILLTRIFSVIMWYHFAFMAVSVAMFGMTVGAMIVYLMPARLKEQRLNTALGLSAFLFGLFMILCLLAQWKIPMFTRNATQLVSATYVVTAIPFLLSGVCVCLALTQFPAQYVGKLYAADLIGAALGCAIFATSIRIAGGPGLVFVLATMASAASVLFLSHTSGKIWKGITMVTCILLAGISLGSAVLASLQKPPLRIAWAKGVREVTPIWEKWNSFSRIRVCRDLDPRRPFGWGFSSTYSPAKNLPQELYLEIDSAAGTVLTGFDGSLGNLEYLKEDVINLAHYLRPQSSVLAVGAGGGRDVLSALVFRQKSVVGVEINDQIWEAVNQAFGNFTGHLDRRPGVTFVNDEARSYLARQQEKFDIIQVSLIDTWAATTAGAFALTENSLYTVEGWTVFLRHLNKGGVLTLSRWYFQDQPGEMYRLTSLATESLLKSGIQDPRKCILIVRNSFSAGPSGSGNGVGTILISNSPFSAADVVTLESVSRKLNYEVVLTPQATTDPLYGKLTSTAESPEVVRSFPLDITAPTDDRPFFFNMLRFRNALEGRVIQQGANNVNIMAVYVLRSLLGLILLLTFVFLILPLLLTVKIGGRKGVFPFFLFFTSIGWGFMLIEISQMQRWIVFLGHPTYSLTTVLFVLLLSGGIGSLTTRNLTLTGLSKSAGWRFVFLVLMLALQGVLTSRCIHAFQSSTTVERIMIAGALLFPAGTFMGMAFPLGIRLSSTRLPALMPWFWGINGGMTVCASVAAVAISLNFGISAVYWIGVSFYLIASLSFLWAAMVPEGPEPENSTPG